MDIFLNENEEKKLLKSLYFHILKDFTNILENKIYTIYCRLES